MRAITGTIYKAVLAGLLVSSIYGCGGGGGTTGSTTGTTTGGTAGGTQPLPFNGGLTGALYYTDAASTYQELDLASGIPSSVRPADGQARPAADGTELAMMMSRALGDPMDKIGKDEINILTRDGLTVTRFSQNESFQGAPKLSPDRSKVVVGWDSLDNNDPVASIPSVFDRSGKVIARFNGARDYDWLPDGRLVLAQGDSILVTDAALGTTSLLKQFPNDTPDYLSVSPDGSQLAFDLGDAGSLKNHVWVMKLDGSGLRQVTTSSFNEDGAAWSPDAGTLMVRQGINYPGNSAGIPSSSCPTTYAVPLSAAAPIVLDAANPAPAFALQQRTAGDAGKVCAYSPLAWRGGLAALASSGGTRSSGSGANAGLTGKLLFDDASNFSVLDLAGAALTTLPGKNGIQGSAPYYGYEGREYAFLKSPPDSGNNSNQQISLAAVDGSTATAVEKPTGFTGPAKLAPGGQRFAVGYASLAAGDPGGARIVNVFNRDGSVIARANGFDSWSWLPDGRLVLASSNTFYVTDAAVSTAYLVGTLPDPISGIEASPDGSAVAFAMDGHLWRTGIDGNSLRQLSASNSRESVPAWSPDSRFVAGLYATDCPEVHAVPADGQRVFLGNPAVSTTELKLQQNASSGLRNVCAFSAMSWR